MFLNLFFIKNDIILHSFDYKYNFASFRCIFLHFFVAYYIELYIDRHEVNIIIIIKIAKIIITKSKNGR